MSGISFRKRSKMRLNGLLLMMEVVAFVTIGCCGGGTNVSPPGHPNAPYPASSTIASISWDFANMITTATGSDLWPVTWGPDNNIYTSWGDGGGFGGTNTLCRANLGFANISGTPTSYTTSDIYGCMSNGSGCDTGATHDAACNTPYASAYVNGVAYSEDIIYVDNTLYTILNMYSPDQQKIAYSTNGGRTFTEFGWSWARSNGSWVPSGFVQFGQNYSGARDTYLYVIGFKWNDFDDTFLARVPKASVSTQANWQWYTSTDPNHPAWSSTWADANPIFTDSANHGYAGHMVYLPTIGRYLFTQNHGSDGSGNTMVQKFGVFDAPEPWGPWTTVYFSDSWGNFGTSVGLWGSFIQKWMSADNKTLYMTFSGGSDGSIDLDALHIVKATLTLTSGTQTLPVGLTLSSSGLIGGTPSLAGATGFTAVATESLNPAQTDNQALSLTIVAANPAHSVAAVLSDFQD